MLYRNLNCCNNRVDFYSVEAGRGGDKKVLRRERSLVGV